MTRLSIDRRDFLRTGALATGAVAFLPFLPPPRDYLRDPLAPRRPGESSQRVVVVGAGLRGTSSSSCR